MKLIKRAAVGLLAAAMAVSMMTACAPSSGGGPSSGSKPNGSTQGPGDDSGSGSGGSGSGGSGSGGITDPSVKQSTIDWKDSELYQYFKEVGPTNVEAELSVALKETSYSTYKLYPSYIVQGNRAFAQVYENTETGFEIYKVYTDGTKYYRNDFDNTAAKWSGWREDGTAKTELDFIKKIFPIPGDTAGTYPEKVLRTEVNYGNGMSEAATLGNATYTAIRELGKVNVGVVATVNQIKYTTIAVSMKSTAGKEPKDVFDDVPDLRR